MWFAGWVSDNFVHRGSSLLDQRKYHVGPFHGLVVAASGLSVAVRTEIQQIVEAGGGKYTRSLTRENTHLIAPANSEFSAKIEVKCTFGPLPLLNLLACTGSPSMEH